MCTSGDYERRAPGPGAEGHILDARTRRPVTDLASVTVVAPTATPTLTLTSCTPKGLAVNRIVVKAVMKGAPATAA